MALLTNINNNSAGLSIEPVKYANKEEHWFSVKLTYFDGDEKTREVEASFHHNDFVNLINNIELLLRGDIDTYLYDPTEPHLRINISRQDKSYRLVALLCSGPIFNYQTYEKYKMNVTSQIMENFVQEIKKDLKNIDPNILFEKVGF